VNTYDVVIVGGGIIGGSIAFELARRNLRVIVLDRQELMHEASWAAAGMLSPAPDCPAAIPLVPLARASLGLYPGFIDAVEESSEINTGYRTGGALDILFHGDAEPELSTLIALHHGLGLACEPLPLEEAQEMEPALGRDARAVAFLPDEASVNPRSLNAALLDASNKAGAELRPGANVVSIMKDNKRCAGVKTAAGETFSAGHLVIAAGCWTSQLSEVAPYAPTRPVRGQMVALRHAGIPLRRVLRSERGYIVPRDHETPQNLVAGSTIENAGYEKAVTSGGLEQILGTVNELAPSLAGAEILDTWSGLRPGTPDQLPILGPTDVEGLMIATGHYRNGILLAPVTAKLIREWITEGRTTLNCGDFSPLRFLRGNADWSAKAK
jgi:glycine oxidase